MSLMQICLTLCTITHVLCHKKNTYEKIQYFSTEHPNVTYLSEKYIKYANVTAKRYGRNNPYYYVSVNIDVVVTLDNRIKVDYYFLELLTNVYKRSFFELHFNLCDLIEKDQFIGVVLRQGPFVKPCPFPPGDYHLHNLTLPTELVPRNFPFRKGRLLVNLTYDSDIMGSAYIDFEVKELKRKISTKSNLKALQTTI